MFLTEDINLFFGKNEIVFILYLGIIKSNFFFAFFPITLILFTLYDILIPNFLKFLSGVLLKNLILFTLFTLKILLFKVLFGVLDLLF